MTGDYRVRYWNRWWNVAPILVTFPRLELALEWAKRYRLHFRVFIDREGQSASR